jgi:hypothetical protein
VTTRGFDKPLYILPFDHRGSFQKKMFGWDGELSPQQTAEIAAAKRVVYDAFVSAVHDGVPKEKAGILVDEQFGAGILKDAAAAGYATSCPAEKSGQDEFDFEYGEDFGKHIEAFHPTFCKVLVRYNRRGRSRPQSAASGSPEAPFRISAQPEPQPIHVRAAHPRRKSPAPIDSRATRRPMTGSCVRSLWLKLSSSFRTRKSSLTFGSLKG